MNKETVMYSYNGIVLSNKKEWATDICHNKDESHKHYAEEKKPLIKVNVYWSNGFLLFYWEKRRLYFIPRFLPNELILEAEYCFILSNYLKLNYFSAS